MNKKSSLLPLSLPSPLLVFSPNIYTLQTGLSRKAATEFSFFLAIPIMFAATGFDLYKNYELLHADDLPMFAAGFVMAFISVLLAVKGLLCYIAHHTFIALAWYRLILGAIVLMHFW